MPVKNREGVCHAYSKFFRIKVKHLYLVDVKLVVPKREEHTTAWS
jgi:hypothetical protein